MQILFRVKSGVKEDMGRWTPEGESGSEINDTVWLWDYGAMICPSLFCTWAEKLIQLVYGLNVSVSSPATAWSFSSAWSRAPDGRTSTHILSKLYLMWLDVKKSHRVNFWHLHRFLKNRKI